MNEALRTVVVGAGPAGAALALLLARGGLAVTLVERRGDPAGLLRGDGLMPSGLEALQRMGLDAALAGLPQRPLEAWSFWVNGTPLFTAAEPMGSPVPCRLIDTPALLALLLQEAGRSACFTLQRGTACDLLWNHDGTRVNGVVLDDCSTLQADLVVACDGRGSRLRRQAALALEPQGPGLEVLWFTFEGVAAQPLQHWLQGRFATLVGDGGSCALFSTARGEVRLGWLASPQSLPQTLAAGSGNPDEPWPQRLARLSPPDLAALWQRYSPGAGGAAHPLSPVRAQGLNMALRDALVAAERLLANPPSRPEAIDNACAAIETLRAGEVRRVQALQRQELGRAELLRQRPWLRQLVAATAPWSGALLARRWQAGQPTLRQGLPLP